MKIKIVFITVLLSCVTLAMNAQNFSAWVQDNARPNLKARYATFKDLKGYSFMHLEIASTVGCTIQVTSTLCNADSREKNGWRTLSIPANQTRRVTFKIMNSCTNGWWWWYQNYRPLKSVRFDDN